MIDRSERNSALHGQKRRFMSQSLDKYLALCLSFIPVVVMSAENTFGHTLWLSREPTHASSDAVSKASKESDVRPLEPGQPIRRELAGGQQHTYHIGLSAGQFVRVIVEQQGIDVVIQLSGPGGEQLEEFDAESRTQGQESVWQVAEVAGTYRLTVRPQRKETPAGAYEIRVEELRAATENDYALQEARNLYDRSVKLLEVAKYDEALPLVARALEIRERILGPDNRDVAAIINGQALLYWRKGDFVKAEPLFQRALAIWEKALGPDRPEVAVALNNLANLYRDKGDYAKTEPLFARALAIREKALGPDHPAVATTLQSLAIMRDDRGEYAKAEPLFQRALAIWEKALGPNHSRVASALNSLAIIYSHQGEYVEAEPLFQRALAIREKVLGPEHPQVGGSLNNLANLYRNKGDHEKAESLFQRAVIIWEKALGPNHPNVAICLGNLALLYADRGEYAKAEPLHQRALAIKEKALGLEHPSVGAALDNLALFYRDRGDQAKAEPLFQRALAIREKSLGPDHPDVANVLNNLAILYRDRGDRAKAEPLFQRALAIQEKSLGPDHPDVAESLDDLAMLSAAQGDLTRAVTFLSRANSVAERNLALNLATGSERQKLAYLALFSRQTDFTLSLHSLMAPSDPQALNLAFTTLLRRKGRGLDAMADTIAILRRHATPENQALLDQLKADRSQLAALTLRESGAAQPDSYRALLQPLKERVERLEATLSARIAEFRAQSQPVTISAIQATLPAGSVLIEFAVYTPREPQTGEHKPPRYMAYLLAAQGQPRWVDLGEAAIIDRAVSAWRRALGSPTRKDVRPLARALDEKVMRAVRSLLGEIPGETRHLLIAPDGALNLIPFAALVDERNQYLVKRYTISHLTSGSDLLRLKTLKSSQNAPLIVANPIFGRVETETGQNTGPAQAKSSEVVQSGLTNGFFPPLPSTEREALAIKAMLPESVVMLRERATEAMLKQSMAPSVLHIATHGFFLRDQESPPVKRQGITGDNPLRVSNLQFNQWVAKIENPLLRSGLVLAGANEHRAGAGDDGMLTAMEAASLDLSGTKLVVLSACNTGVGEVKNGEGVYGLRRALVLAGSETQVMSLWPMLDKEMGNLMVGYYRRLLKGEGRGEALRQIQLEILKQANTQHPYYWASFILAGEWADLDGQR
jgi:CHAT domain-containing protein/tetratricopeptide (TPR) repeat protein